MKRKTYTVAAAGAAELQVQVRSLQKSITALRTAYRSGSGHQAVENSRPVVARNRPAGARTAAAGDSLAEHLTS